jgi:hypothetical protein
MHYYYYYYCVIVCYLRILLLSFKFACKIRKELLLLLLLCFPSFTRANSVIGLWAVEIACK